MIKTKQNTKQTKQQLHKEENEIIENDVFVVTIHSIKKFKQQIKSYVMEREPTWIDHQTLK